VSHAAVSQNLPDYQQRKSKDCQLIRLSLIQVVLFILLNICNAGYNIYQFITKTDGKSADQSTIDSIINSISTDLISTHSAVCFTFVFEIQKKNDFINLFSYLYNALKKKNRFSMF
jgi:hypothetical protein